MNILKVALLQIAPMCSLEGNLAKGIESCKKAKNMGADIALFPKCTIADTIYTKDLMKCGKKMQYLATVDLFPHFRKSQNRLIWQSV